MIQTISESTLNRHLRTHHGFTYETLRECLRQGWTPERFDQEHARLHADETAAHLGHRHPNEVRP